jgi:hypothetical protein
VEEEQRIDTHSRGMTVKKLKQNIYSIIYFHVLFYDVCNIWTTRRQNGRIMNDEFERSVAR